VSVIEGKGLFRSPAAGDIELVSGDAVLLFPMEPATYFDDGNSWTTRWIVWNGSDADRLIAANCFSPAKPLIKGGLGVIASVYKRIEELFGREDTGAIMERRNIMHELLLELYRLQNISGAAIYRDLLDRVNDFMEKNLYQSFAIENMARHCGLSESHFRRLFKAATGSGPVEFITSRRISAAKEMLRQNVPVKEIAQRLAFSSEFYFRRVFKEKVGIPPGQYR
jgi:AraC-like DNA-binding protein